MKKVLEVYEAENGFILKRVKRLFGIFSQKTHEQYTPMIIGNEYQASEALASIMRSKHKQSVTVENQKTEIVVRIKKYG